MLWYAFQVLGIKIYFAQLCGKSIHKYNQHFQIHEHKEKIFIVAISSKRFIKPNILVIELCVECKILKKQSQSSFEKFCTLNKKH